MTEPRTMIIIAGMHRSGTSALARVINLLGADLANDLIPAGIGNELGHWESRSAQEIHNAMLADAGSSVTSAVALPQAWFIGSAAQAFVDRVAHQISADYPRSNLIVLKDPRICLFIPIWLAALRKLQIVPRFVIPFRQPAAVAASLGSRQRLLDPFDDIPIAQGIAMWLRYVLASEHDTRGHLRSFVSFEALLSDWRSELGRIGRQLGMTWPHLDQAGLEIDSFIDSRRRTAVSDRTSSDGSTAIADDVYAALERAVDDPSLASETFDAAAAAISSAEAIFGTYIRAKEQQLHELRAVLDQHSRRHADDIAAAHRAFDQAIKERDARIEEAVAYAASLEAHTRHLTGMLAEFTERKADQTETSPGADTDADTRKA